MSNDFGVTSGHVEYSNIRFYSDTRHMVIFEAPKYRPEFDQFYYERPVYDPEAPHRTRLFLSEEAYKTIRRMELKGMLSILHHANVINGYLVDDTPKSWFMKRTNPPGTGGRRLIYISTLSAVLFRPGRRLF